MKLEIYGDKAPDIPTVILRLVPGGNPGTVSLVAVNAEGRTMACGHLLEIGPTGKVYFQHGIAPSLGFELRDGQRLKVRP